MSHRKTLAVVGGGIVGLSIAWRAAQHGFAVTLFEKGTLGSEASWAGAGMLAPGGEVEDESLFSKHLIAARAQYPAFVAELQSESGYGIDFQTNGALDLAYSEEERTELALRTKLQQRLGITSKPVSVEDVGAFWPRLRTQGLLTARFVPGDAVVDPRQTVTALRVACERHGAVIREHTAVSKINLEQADFTVVACGAWSGGIRVEGIPPLPATQPVRGHLIAYRQPLDTLTTIIRHGSHYLLQRSNGVLIGGASVEHAGFDRSIDLTVARRLESASAFIVPHLGETSPAEVWNGLRPGSDQLQVGAWHSPRLLLAYGHYRNGILLAPWTADRILELLRSA